jgi:hypothetical protein
MNPKDSEHTEEQERASTPGVTRRRFLGGVGVALRAVSGGPEAARGGLTARARRAYKIREQAARFQRDLPPVAHPTNGDEELHPARLGNYSKGLPHNSFGEVDPDAYTALVTAATAGAPADFEAIPLGGTRKLVSPQSGLAFDLEGCDAQYLTVPAAPALSSAEAAGEAVELYWMALLRDVNYLDYPGHPDVEAAVADLNSLTTFHGLRTGGVITANTLFRDRLIDARKGPYISQFLWRPAPFGAENIERRLRTLPADSDHLTDFGDWLDAQNGVAAPGAAHDPVRRYIRNGRDLSEWVHIDVLFQAYFTACLILGTPPDASDDVTGGGIGCPVNSGNPYRLSRNQEGFATFGGPHFKTLLCEISTRALKATWFQKWLMHRRLRPEAYGGLVHGQTTSHRYPNLLHPDVLDSPVLERVHSRFGSYLLPQAFPEGSPLHPSYTAGHATVAGACVTILKALFDETYVIPNPVVPTADGLALVPYLGPDLTVGGELNKLASNVATGRNQAGVHWRSDALESLLLGEEIAIQLLRDQKSCYNEDFDGFTFTRFGGARVTV